MRILMILLLATWAFSAATAETPADAPSLQTSESAATIGEEAANLAEQHAAEEEEFKTPSGYKKKKKGKRILYCKNETPIGTRLPTEYCFTQEQLVRIEKSKQGMQDDIGMRQRMCTTQSACGEF